MVYVTTLADYHKVVNGQTNPNPIVGSLRWACERVSGPRTIIFRVGGTIQLTGRLFLSGEQGSYVTIAGQTAPGDGVQITGYPLHISGGAHDIIVRYLRSRPGYVGPEDYGIKDALTIHSESGVTRDVVVDHCSLEWAIDENINVGANTERITLQWCIFGEGSVFGHAGGSSNSFGMLLDEGIPSDQYLSVHHSLFVNNVARNPKLGQNGGLVDLVNNYICNYSFIGTEILPYYANSPRANFVGNVYDFGVPGYRAVYSFSVSSIASGSFYTLDNRSEFTPLANSDPWLIMGDLNGIWPDYILDRSKQRLTPWPIPAAYSVTSDPAANVVDLVLADVGANVPARDALDQRLITEARNGTGDPGFGPSVSDHENWPVLANGTPYPDTDTDGMSDSWEAARGLDPSDPDDGLLDDDGDGYTNLEEFLNSLVGE